MRKCIYCIMENETIEKSIKKEYILCFPPREKTAGNFFAIVSKVWKWKPEVKATYSFWEGKERVCLFLKEAPRTVKGDWLVTGWIHWKIRRYIRRYDTDTSVGSFYEMKSAQDYPYSLRMFFAKEFVEGIYYGKRVHVGFIEGNALSRKDLIGLIRKHYDKVNYLTIFSKEPDVYGELVEDAWEQYGLVVTVTGCYESLQFCDYILDCTVLPFEEKINCRKGCAFFSLSMERDKMRSARKMGEGVRFDSCAASLDRAFHNKV